MKTATHEPNRGRPTVGVVLGLAVGMGLTACRMKSSEPSSNPDMNAWTLAEIEAELDNNDAVLANAGIMVAMADPIDIEQDAGDEVDVKPVTTPGSTHAGEKLGVEASPPEPAPEPEPMDAPMEPPSPVADYDDAEEQFAPESPSRRRRFKRRDRSTRSSKSDSPSRCDRVCGLAEATCDLETQICTLAEEHFDEPRYQKACRRSELQCSAAADACRRCED